MENSFSKEVRIQLNKSWRRYKEWLKPKPDTPVFLKIVQTFLKSFTVLLLVVFSPVVLIILIVGFLAAL